MSDTPTPETPKYRSVEAVGARVGFLTCPTCRCALVLDPADVFDTYAEHMAWHDRFDAEALSDDR